MLGCIMPAPQTVRTRLGRSRVPAGIGLAGLTPDAGLYPGGGCRKSPSVGFCAAEPENCDMSVVMPEHLHAVWQLPKGDSVYSRRWQEIKHFVASRIATPVNHRAGRHPVSSSRLESLDVAQQVLEGPSR